MEWKETAEVGPEDVPPMKEPTIEPNGPQLRVEMAFQKPNRYRIVDITSQGTQMIASNGKETFSRTRSGETSFTPTPSPHSPPPLGLFAERSGLAMEILHGTDPSKMYKERPKASPVTVSLSTRDNDDGFIRIVGVTQTKTFTRTNIYLIGKWDYLLRQFTTIEQTGTEKYVYDQKYINVRANPDLSSTTFSLTPHRKK
jgi:outer membrane lipoprotein-sorting protein